MHITPLLFVSILLPVLLLVTGFVTTAYLLVRMERQDMSEKPAYKKVVVLRHASQPRGKWRPPLPDGSGVDLEAEKYFYSLCPDALVDCDVGTRHELNNGVYFEVWWDYPPNA